jgi:glycine/serine hydroxymethyltransferase
MEKSTERKIADLIESNKGGYLTKQDIQEIVRWHDMHDIQSTIKNIEIDYDNITRLLHDVKEKSTIFIIPIWSILIFTIASLALTLTIWIK